MQTRNMYHHYQQLQQHYPSLDKEQGSVVSICVQETPEQYIWQEGRDVLIAVHHILRYEQVQLGA